jgi:hypothetical protein
MNELIKLAFALIDGGVMRSRRRSTAEIACFAIAFISAAVCAIAAVACALAALWIFALPHVGPVGAPIVVAGVLLAVCLAMLALIFYAPKTRRASSPLVDAAPALLLAEATRLLKEHKGPVLMAALLAGLIAGKNEK